MSKTHSPQRLRELAAEGRLILFRMAASRAREKKQKQAAPASRGTVDTGARQFNTDVVNPAAIAAQIIKAGQKARGEIVDETPRPTGQAAAIHAAADTARAGGRPLPAPSGIAEQIIAAGRKRRGEAT